MMVVGADVSDACRMYGSGKLTNSSSHHLPPGAPPKATPRPSDEDSLFSRRDRGGLDGSRVSTDSCGFDCHLGRDEEEDEEAAGGAYGWCRYDPWWPYDWAARGVGAAVAMVNRSDMQMQVSKQ